MLTSPSRPVYSNAGTNSGWTPIPTFNRTDADVSIYFLAANCLTYLSPVTDPLFSATFQQNFSSLVVYVPDYDITVMRCADQYQICNPTNQVCTSLGGQRILSQQVSTLG